MASHMLFKIFKRVKYCFINKNFGQGCVDDQKIKVKFISIKIVLDICLVKSNALQMSISF